MGQEDSNLIDDEINKLHTRENGSIGGKIDCIRAFNIRTKAGLYVSKQVVDGFCEKYKNLIKTDLPPPEFKFSVLEGFDGRVRS